jgi:hypothetical protein
MVGLDGLDVDTVVTEAYADADGFSWLITVEEGDPLLDPSYCQFDFLSDDPNYPFLQWYVPVGSIETIPSSYDLFFKYKANQGITYPEFCSKGFRAQVTYQDSSLPEADFDTFFDSNKMTFSIDSAEKADFAG